MNGEGGLSSKLISVMQAHILYYIRICSSFLCNLYVELFFFLIFRLLLLYFRILLYIAIYIFSDGVF